MLIDLKSDINRYAKVGNYRSLLGKIKMFIVNEPIWYLISFRIGNYFKDDCKFPIIKQLGYFIFFVIHRVMSLIMGIQIPLGTRIAKGLYLPHYGLTVVHQKTIIGEHCNIGQGVTIGIAGRGEKKGVPEIGNYVYIAPGAKIIGKIKVGNNVMIGANAVVTKDVPDNAVVAGIPARIISYKGWEVDGNPYQQESNN